MGDRLARFQDRIGHATRIKRDGADRVIVAGDNIVHAFGAVVAVHHADHGDGQFARLGHGDIFITHVDNEQGVGDALHVLDPGQARLQLVELALIHKLLFLADPLQAAVGLHGFDIFQPIDGLAHGLEIGQQAAQPAPVDIGHAAAGGLFGDDGLGRAFGGDKQDGGLFGRHAAREIERLLVQGQGFFQIDDVDLVALAEQIRGHAGVPVTGLMTEMNAGFQHFTHGDVGHDHSPVRVKPPRAPHSNPPGVIPADTLYEVTARV